jgi:cobaltochelatase CobS
MATLGLEGRNALRAILKAQGAAWTAYCQSNNVNMSMISGEIGAAAAKHFGIDLFAVKELSNVVLDIVETGNTHKLTRSVMPQLYISDAGDAAAAGERAIADMAAKLEAERKAAARRDEEARSAAARAAAANAATVNKSDNAGGQLAALIAQIAGGAMDREQVGRLVDEKLSTFKAGVDAGDVASIVNVLIEERLANLPARVLEVRRDGATLGKVDGHKHPLFETLLRAATVRDVNGFAPNIYLSGPAGSGKTHAAQAVAKALGQKFYYNGSVAMPFELLGFVDAGGVYRDTPFRQAYENGGVYVFDEVDGSDANALLAVNGHLAGSVGTFPDKLVERHPDFVCIATANTMGQGATADYVGRTKLDGAFLNRFPIKLAWFYDNALELAISGNKAFAERVQRARARAAEKGLKVLITPRHSIAGAALIAAGFSADEAAGLTFLADLNANDKAAMGAV